MCEVAGGHAGYEIAPFIPSMESLILGVLSWVQPAWNLRGGLNTVRHHDMHHRFPTRHFSLYFTHWDRWCGTEHVDYRTAVSVHFCFATGLLGEVVHIILMSVLCCSPGIVLWLSYSKEWVSASFVTADC